MKRENPNLNSHQNLLYCNGNSSYSTGDCGYSMAAAGKCNLWEETQQDSDMDELLAVLGYTVKSSDMAEVAQKLEQLEEFMGHNEFSQLGSDSVHYNPSDLSNWLETMLSELDPAPPPPPPPPPSFLLPAQSSTIDFTDPKSKRLKTNPTESTRSTRLTESTQPVILVGSQENGIRLVHALMACAESVQQNNLNLAESLVKKIGILARSQTGAMRKVATYFAEALARRIFRIFPPNHLDHSLSDFLQTHFYESCPYLKFAHFTANQAILEAFEGKKRVHVIDFGINQGLQWPALLQALALRPGGPPSFRLTGIGPPAPDNSDYLQEVGWKLAQLAESIHIEFEFRGFAANSLADLNSSMFELGPSDSVDSVAVNSVFELHKLLARPGSIEKVLDLIIAVRPEIVTIVEQEANHNGSVFLDRFTESLHYYSAMFDSMEGSVQNHDKVMSEVYLGKQIFNVVACEGIDRVERHESLSQWQTRLESTGFVPALLGSNAFKQASMLLALFTGGDGYTVEENGGCLMLGWHTRPLIATSAWKLGRRATESNQ